MEKKQKKLKETITSYVSEWLYETLIDGKVFILEKIKFIKYWTHIYEVKALFDKNFYSENLIEQLEKKYWKKIKKINN